MRRREEAFRGSCSIFGDSWIAPGLSESWRKGWCRCRPQLACLTCSGGFSSTETTLNQIVILHQTWQEGTEQSLYATSGIGNVPPRGTQCCLLQGREFACLCNFWWTAATSGDYEIIKPNHTRGRALPSLLARQWCGLQVSLKFLEIVGFPKVNKYHTYKYKTALLAIKN